MFVQQAVVPDRQVAMVATELSSERAGTTEGLTGQDVMAFDRLKTFL